MSMTPAATPAPATPPTIHFDFCHPGFDFLDRPAPTRYTGFFHPVTRPTPPAP